jgi:hypothetical protein
MFYEIGLHDATGCLRLSAEQPVQRIKSMAGGSCQDETCTALSTLEVAARMPCTSPCREPKQPSLKLKPRQEQLVGSLPSDVALTPSNQGPLSLSSAEPSGFNSCEVSSPILKRLVKNK